MKLQQKSVGATCGAAVIAGAVALALTVGQSAPAKVSSRSAPKAPVSAALRRSFSIFRHAGAGEAGRRARARAAVTSLPANTGNGLLASYGVTPAAASYVAVGPQGGWVLPGSAGACLLMPDPSSRGAFGVACGDVAEVLSGRLVVRQVAPSGRETVYGLAPDGNTTVRASLAGGGSTTLPVVENVYSTSASSVTAISLLSDTGQSVTSPVPAP